MSRGAGQVMIDVVATAMWLELLDSPPTLFAGSRALASIVYRTNDPTRAEIFAIRRAVGSMERRRQLEARWFADDLRVKFVRLSPWMRGPLAEFLDPSTSFMPSLEQIAAFIEDLLSLVRVGLISAVEPNGVELSARPRSLVIHGEILPVRLAFPPGGPVIETTLLFARDPQE